MSSCEPDRTSWALNDALAETQRRGVDIDERTWRYWRTRGLFDDVERNGRTLTLHEHHLDRIATIRRLQQHGIPLDIIAAQLERGGNPAIGVNDTGNVDVWCQRPVRDDTIALAAHTASDGRSVIVVDDNTHVVVRNGCDPIAAHRVAGAVADALTPTPERTPTMTTHTATRPVTLEHLDIGDIHGPTPEPAQLVTSDRTATFTNVHTELDGTVTGNDVTWTITQRYRNDLGVAVDVDYIFGLSPTANVHRCTARFGNRTVEATLKERRAARDEYTDAVANGQRAALVEQDRPSTFTCSLGNVDIDDEITITLEITDTVRLDRIDNTWTAHLRMPTGVGERYSETEGRVVDPHRATVHTTTNPQELGTLGWSLTINHDGSISRLRASAPGRVAVTGGDTAHASGELTVSDDIVIAWDIGDNLPRHAAVIRDSVLRREHNIDTGNNIDGNATVHVTVELPALDIERDDAGNRDVVILLDRSGSMGSPLGNATKMAVAGHVAAEITERLVNGDRYNVATFDSVLETLHDNPVDASDANRNNAASWLRNRTPRGGTNMTAAISWACDQLRNSGRDGHLVIITDAQVTGEDSVVGALGATNITVHAVGVDSRTNLGLIDRLAETSGGTSWIVDTARNNTNDIGSIRYAADGVTAAVAPEAVTDLTATCRAANGTRYPITLEPYAAPAGGAINLIGRVTLPGRVRIDSVDVEGTTAGGAPWAARAACRTGNVNVFRRWTKTRLNRAECAWVRGAEELDQQTAVDLSVAAGILSRWTAFVAVDRDGNTVERSGIQTSVAHHARLNTGSGLMRGATFNAAGPTAGATMSLMASAANPPGTTTWDNIAASSLHTINTGHSDIRTTWGTASVTTTRTPAPAPDDTGDPWTTLPATAHTAPATPPRTPQTTLANIVDTLDVSGNIDRTRLTIIERQLRELVEHLDKHLADIVRELVDAIGNNDTNRIRASIEQLRTKLH